MVDELFYGFTRTQWISIAGALLLIASWFCTSWLSSRRDRTNKEREIRLQYLIDAYDKLSYVADRSLTEPGNTRVIDDVEQAIAKIQLFGTQKEIALTREFIDQLILSVNNKRGNPSVTPLMLELRNRLRDELKMPPISSKIHGVRIKITKDEKSKL